MTEGAQRAIEAAVREPQGRADVGAYARLAGYVEVHDAPVAPGVWDNAAQAAFDQPPLPVLVDLHRLNATPQGQKYIATRRGKTVNRS